MERVFAGLGIYNSHWQYNALAFPVVHHVLALAFDSALAWTLAKAVVAALLVSVIAWLSFHPRFRDAPPLQKVRHCAIGIAALFVLSPTAFPWYFCWLLPLLCLFPRWPWILLSLLLPLNYLDFHSAASLPWVHLSILGCPILGWLTWGLFLVALATEAGLHVNRRLATRS